ncbi:MAG TPA: DUF2232 domain-containing protein [Vicinamibacteria bacterium]|nr:DUF2232 domain-containing protein [Vicinamibacteria bacterium]
MAVEARVGERPEPRAGGIVGAALAAVVLFSVVYVAPVLWIVATVAPFPLAIHRLSRGFASALLATLLAASLVAWLFGPLQAAKFLLVLVLPGLLIVEAVVRGRGLRRGAAWAFLALAAETTAALFVLGPRMATGILAHLDEVRSPQFLAELSTTWPQESVDEIAERATALYNAMEVVYPGAFFVLAAMMVLVNAALVRAYLARRDPGWLDGGEFEGLRFSLALPALFVLGGALVAFVPLRAVGYNVVLVTAFFFAVQGLAVVAYYAHRLAGPLFLRVGLLGLVLLNPWAPHILALLGLFDTWADFRRWADPPATDAQ